MLRMGSRKVRFRVGAGLMAFAKGIAAGTLRWARGQEGRFDAPLSSSGLHLPLTKKGLLAPFKPQSRRAPYKKASRFAQTGCGAQRPLRALSGTRVLLTAAPTAPPCIRRWRRSSPLHFFLASPIYRPLSRCATAPRRGAGAADAVSQCDPSREKEF